MSKKQTTAAAPDWSSRLNKGAKTCCAHRRSVDSHSVDRFRTILTEFLDCGEDRDHQIGSMLRRQVTAS
jgi:hypothetical protein